MQSSVKYYVLHNALQEKSDDAKVIPRLSSKTEEAATILIVTIYHRKIVCIYALAIIADNFMI